MVVWRHGVLQADAKLVRLPLLNPSHRADTQRETWVGDMLGRMSPAQSLAREEQDHCWPTAPQQCGKAARLGWAEHVCRTIWLLLLLLLLREKD